MPDSDNLIQAIFLEINIVKGHTGQGISQNILETIQRFGLSSENFNGGSYDGQYFHLNVPELLDDALGFKGDKRKHSDWDALHRAGLQDIHIRKDPKFSWLNDATKVITSAFKFINWGQEFEHFLEIADHLESDESFTDAIYKTFPCFFSETRFANHCARVYKAFHKDYPALLTTLEDVQLSNAGGNSKEREKAHDASTLKSSIANKKFCLYLSGLCDVYSVFGNAVNILQTVNMLPHEKYHKFNLCINAFNDMVDTISNHQSDKCKNKCQWQTYHKDLEKLLCSGKYRGISIVEDDSEGRREKITRYYEKKNEEKSNQPKAQTVVECNLIKFIQQLHDKLKNNVYDEDDVAMINKIECLANLKDTILKLKARGVTIVAATEGEKFLKNAKSLCHTIEEIPDNILKMQHNLFLKKLLEIYNTMSQDELNEIKSIDVIKRFLSKNEKLYEGIEFIMHSISAACVAISVESIVESVVSIYETRQTKSRTLSDDRANYEMQIGYNGPDLAKADTMLKKAMDSYFKAHKQGKWHFTIDPNRLCQKL